MRRFAWRLQRVLDIAVKQEQVKKAELLDITEKFMQTQSDLLAQKRILEDLIDRLRRYEPQRRMSEQEFFLKYSTVSNDSIRRLKDAVSELESQQAAKIAEVLKARRFKKGLEKLRTEAKQKYIRSQEKLEQKDSDDRAVVGFARRSHPSADVLENVIG